MFFENELLRNDFLTAARDGDHDMEVMCQFWSHFLVHNFNAQMYNEFRSLSLDDFFCTMRQQQVERAYSFLMMLLSNGKASYLTMLFENWLTLVRKYLRVGLTLWFFFTNYTLSLTMWISHPEKPQKRLTVFSKLA